MKFHELLELVTAHDGVSFIHEVCEIERCLEEENLEGYLCSREFFQKCISKMHQEGIDATEIIHRAHSVWGEPQVAIFLGTNKRRFRL